MKAKFLKKPVLSRISIGIVSYIELQLDANLALSPSSFITTGTTWPARRGPRSTRSPLSPGWPPPPPPRLKFAAPGRMHSASVPSRPPAYTHVPARVFPTLSPWWIPSRSCGSSPTVLTSVSFSRASLFFVKQI